MLWVALVVVGFLVVFGYQRWRVMAPLFADEHLSELAAGLPDLKRRALAAQGTPGDPPSLKTAHVALAYSLSRDGSTWVHHLSVSSPLTPARAAGTFLLGLARAVLGLDAQPFAAFVSQRGVFHLEVRLSDDEERAYAERAVEQKPARELRAMAHEGRSAILPRLGSAKVKLPAGRG